MAAAYAYGAGGATTEVEDSSFGAAVVDFDDDLLAVVLVGDEDEGSEFYFPVCGGESLLAEYFAAGGFSAFEAVGVEGAFVGVECGGV